MALNNKSWSQLLSTQSNDQQLNENLLNKALNSTNNQMFVSLDDVMSEQLANKLTEEDFEQDINSIDKQIKDINNESVIGAQNNETIDKKERIDEFIRESGLDLNKIQQMFGNE
jgi:hypothetical protein